MHRLLKPLLFTTIASVACAAVAAGAWKAAQWHALFTQVPAPPATLTKAGAMIGAITDARGHHALGPIDPALVKSHKGLLAGAASMNAAAASGAAAVTGIDPARMQSDPAYAAQMQQKMESMTQAEKMQMAMQMMAAQRASAAPMNVALLRAQGELNSYLASDGRQILGTQDARLRQGMQDNIIKYDARHASLDKQLQDLLKACPPIPRSSNECGDTDCPPQPSCIAGINARAPALIAAHRKLASQELADDRALFADVRAKLDPVMARIADLTKGIEATGGKVAQTQAGNAALMQTATRLQQFTALAAMRTGYWQNIRQKQQPDDYFIVGNLGYGYTVGGDRIESVPVGLPDDW